MLSRERLERYRVMTPSERWAETSALMAMAWESLRRLPSEEQERRLRVARRRGFARVRRLRPARR